MNPKILVTREVFDETLAYLAQHCDVDSNQEDRAFEPEALARRLADKDGVMCALTDRVDAKLIEKASKDLGAPVEIEGFVRFKVGEGIENVEADFADEVAQMAGGR